MNFPRDYTERVYAGVLGKLIGVYLGRPFEGSTYDRIMKELGEITDYVHERLNVPLIVTDDDISGTFTFLRALADHDYRPDITPAQIGQTWLNYLIEERTILWWGGMGNSTEHTAYLRLKHGISAPDSGSIATNGKVVAEQIGAQIFIDGWAMLAPGNPALAVDLARRAASVSHDGEAIYGAQVIAAIEAQAFIENDLNRLIDTALSFIPADSTIARMIGDIRTWHTTEPDWRKARALLDFHYGYHKFGGSCHMVPNHGLIILSLLYGGGDFDQSLMIVNTSGWDTDCNSGNVGCILGIRNGLSALSKTNDWRSPVADRMYISSADGGRAITDAVVETMAVVNTARQLAGLPPEAPKQGARFHFDLPGAVQGFQASAGVLENVAGHSALGARSLAVNLPVGGQPIKILTPTFAPPEIGKPRTYDLAVSPTLYPGQTIRAAVSADNQNRAPIACRLMITTDGTAYEGITLMGTAVQVAPGESVTLEWTLDAETPSPILQVGWLVETVDSAGGTLYLDYLTWSGAPNVRFTRPAYDSLRWYQAWMNAADHFSPHWRESFRVSQSDGRGMIMQGTREWMDYQVSAAIIPRIHSPNGIGIRVQGLQRYYALLLVPRGKLRLVKMFYGESVLGETDFEWHEDQSVTLTLEAENTHLRAWVNGSLLFDVQDGDHPLMGGASALICEEGCMSCDEVRITPVGLL